MSNETVQNFSFPTTQHKLVYVKLYINKFHFVHPPFSKMGKIIAPGTCDP